MDGVVVVAAEHFVSISIFSSVPDSIAFVVLRLFFTVHRRDTNVIFTCTQQRLRPLTSFVFSFAFVWYCCCFIFHSFFHCRCFCHSIRMGKAHLEQLLLLRVHSLHVFAPNACKGKNVKTHVVRSFFTLVAFFFFFFALALRHRFSLLPHSSVHFQQIFCSRSPSK